MRVLLLFTSYPSAEHLHALRTCWPGLIRASPLLLAADVLLQVNGVNETAGLGRRALSHAIDALPNERKRVEVHSPNPGKQAGALFSMHVALTSGWLAPYEWVIRTNPDAYIYDDEFLAQQVRDPD